MNLKAQSHTQTKTVPGHRRHATKSPPSHNIAIKKQNYDE
uniref:Uncharacterized protein n=1 Tax=Arundo donax TaxID=35708 RepID=A0A0A9SN66_ARUDO